MPESVQKSVQNSASIPQPHRGEIEIDGERLGYALVECDEGISYGRPNAANTSSTSSRNSARLTGRRP